MHVGDKKVTEATNPRPQSSTKLEGVCNSKTRPSKKLVRPCGHARRDGAKGGLNT